MLGRLRQWWQLPWAERGLLLVLMATQPVLSLSLRVLGYGKTRGHVEALSKHPAPREASAADLAAADRLARLARIAGRRGVLVTTCLRQALAVHGLLRRRGLRPELKLGVDRLPGRAADMHAWVELDGVALAHPRLRHRALEEVAKASANTATPRADTADQ
ncbi:MAG: lasso peptide biosynthesis B2 protein [Thermomonas sp.]|nr:lasso peptide biosynthesis B2 protein [Thermomonas sp.]